MGHCHANDRKAKASKKSGGSGKFDQKELRNDLIHEINEVRYMHQVSALCPNKEIENIAQSFATKLAKKGDIEYSNSKYKGEELGEILFYYNADCDAEIVIETWNKDSKTFKYNSKNPEASSFAQIVWKSSQLIGIGIAKDSRGGTFIVANFYPGGNVVGQFANNVFPPIGNATKKPKEKPKEKEAKKESSKGNKSSSGFTQFDADALQTHNYYRRKHHVPPLTLNKDLCKIAQAYAQRLCSTRCFEHSKNKYKGFNIGENLYRCTGKVATGEMATTSWYDEIKTHNFKKDFQHASGHFSQLVWKGSQEVGFGVANKGTNYYVVANYYPAGNIIGDFANNVFKA